MYRWISHTFESNDGAPKSVITTSQGSALFIDYIMGNPRMLENVHSVVFVSPATIAENRAGRKMTENFIALCEEKNKKILLLLTEIGWARWDPGMRQCVHDVTDTATREVRQHSVTDCPIIIRSRVCETVFVRNTNHNFDFEHGNGLTYGAPNQLCAAILNWCRFPTTRSSRNIVAAEANAAALPEGRPIGVTTTEDGRVRVDIISQLLGQMAMQEQGPYIGYKRAYDSLRDVDKTRLVKSLVKNASVNNEAIKSDFANMIGAKPGHTLRLLEAFRSVYG